MKLVYHPLSWVINKLFNTLLKINKIKKINMAYEVHQIKVVGDIYISKNKYL